MAAYNNSQTEEEKRRAAENAARLAVEQATNTSPLSRQANIAANQTQYWDNAKQLAQSAIEGASQFLNTPPSPPEALQSRQKEQTNNTPLSQQPPLTELPQTPGATPPKTSPLTQSPAPITQQAMSGIPDLAKPIAPLESAANVPPQQPRTTNNPWVVAQSPVGGVAGGLNQGNKTVINAWDYPGAKEGYNPRTGEYLIDNRLPPEVRAAVDKRAAEIEASGNQVWGSSDSNALIQSQMMAKNQPENLAYDWAAQNRTRVNNGRAPIESPYDKMSAGAGYKDQLGLAKFLQDREQFSTKQEMDMRAKIFESTKANLGGGDPSLVSAYTDSNISLTQFGALASVAQQGDPAKTAEAYKRLQEQQKNAEDERKRLEEEGKKQRLSSKEKSKSRLNYSMANLSSLIG